MGFPAIGQRIPQNPSTGVAGANGNTDQPTAAVDSTAVVNPVNKGWVGGLRSTQQRDVGGTQQPVTAQAAKIPMVEVLANSRAMLDKLEGDLKGRMNSGMRDAMNSALENGTPMPAGLEQFADLAQRTADEIMTEKGSLSPQEQKNLMSLLDMDNRYPLSSATINALPDDDTSPIGGNLGDVLSKLSDISTPDAMKAVMAAAAKDGISPGQLADQLISGKGAISEAMSNKVGPAALQTLAMAQSTKPADARQTMDRLDGLQLLAGRGSTQSQWSPQTSGSNGQLSANDVRQMIQSGTSPNAIADQLISGQGNLRGRMTVDALNALESSMVPSGPMSANDKQQFMQRIDALQRMQTAMPAAPYLAGQLQQPATFDPQAARRALNPLLTGSQSNAATSAASTLNSGFAPTGNRSFDAANAVSFAPTYSKTEQAMLNNIQDPQQRAMQELQMQMQKQALLATMLTNLANMRHEMLKAVANNLRA